MKNETPTTRVTIGKYELRKDTDDMFEGNHPNGIYAGHTVYSDNKPEVIIGERYAFAGYGKYLLTSTVQDIVSETETETIFKTTNSTYKLITNS